MSNKEKHWEKTKGLMFLTLIIWFVFGYLIFMFGSSLNTSSFLGYPLAYYMCAQGSIIAFVVLSTQKSPARYLTFYMYILKKVAFKVFAQIPVDWCQIDNSVNPGL